MGKTLFWYIFRDLVKVFVLTAVSLAGILSFAGLLRPLTERGLGAEQAVAILFWLMPAMLAYSLPVAALFATTFVYGRLSADNEATATKAAGMPASPMGLLLPSTVLAALLGVIALAALSFLVPAANLQVEQTVWSNLAQLASNTINRTSRIKIITDQGGVQIFASRARLPDEAELADIRQRAVEAAGGPEAAAATGVGDDVQVVQLENAHVIGYDEAAEDESIDVPSEIYGASTATVYIDPPSYARGGGRIIDIERAFDQTALANDQFLVTIVLENGLKFPRQVGVMDATGAGAGGARPTVAAASVTQFGPIRRETPVRLNPKFMDVRELRTLLAQPEQARRITELIDAYARDDQRRGFLLQLERQAMNGGATLDGLNASRATFTSGQANDYAGGELKFVGQPVRFEEARQTEGGRVERIVIEADNAAVRADAFGSAQTGTQQRLVVVFSFSNARVEIDGVVSTGRSIERRVVVPVPDDLAKLPTLTAGQYLNGDAVALGGSVPDAGFRKDLLGKLVRQRAEVIGEMHGRAAFVVACVVLPLLGSGLGLMFRSGNFLTAFTVSTLPAATCVLMIVIGQKAIEESARNFKSSEVAEFRDERTSRGGLALLWAGDAVVAVGATVLLWRLRQR